jgi:hypothetical protein
MKNDVKCNCLVLSIKFAVKHFRQYINNLLEKSENIAQTVKLNLFL